MAVAGVLLTATAFDAGSQATRRGTPRSGRLVVVTPRFELALLEPEGTGLMKLTGRLPCINSPRWAPDAVRVAFVRELSCYRRSPKAPVYVLHVRGCRLRIVGRGHAPRWSPDGRRLMFVDVRGLNFSPVGETPPAAARIVVVDIANGRRRVIGRGERPAWSPDGKRVAFFRYTYSKEHTWSITSSVLLTMNANGSAVRAVASGPGEPDALYDPQWSPDGRTIAVWGKLVDAATGVMRQLAPGFGFGPVEWSRDGRSIAFTGRTSDSAVVGTVDVATGSVRIFARLDQLVGLFGSIEWSPSGEQLGFVRCIYDPEYRCYVYVADANGSRLRRVVEISEPFDAFDWGRS